jgi:hypothetical protein
MRVELSAKVVLSSAMLLLFSQASFAATGTIKLYHLNSDVIGRGACIQMNPALPGSGWACVWEGRLYKEFNDLFREAYFAGKTCTVTWSTLDMHGHGLVSVAQCQ